MRKTAMIFAAACLILFGGAAACSDTTDLEDDINAQATQIQALTDAAQRNALLNAVNILDTAGLHEVDEEANDNNVIVAGASGPVSRAVIAVAVTEWPEELQASAEEMQAALETLHEALESEDVAAVAEAGAAAHEAQHEFSESVQNYLKEAAGLPVEEHEEEPAEGTPAAEEATPTTAG